MSPETRPSRLRLPAALALALAFAGGAGTMALAPGLPWAVARSAPGPSPEEQAAIAAGYVCPMHPEVTASGPGTCPICGMDLVASHDGHVHAHGVSVDPRTLSGLGLRTVAVERRPIGRELRALGSIVPDGRGVVSMTSKFGGWIRRLDVHAVGERVRRGQVLYEIYSPELVQKEREYFQFLTRRKQILQSVGDVSQQENEYVMDLLRDSQKEREELMRNDLDIETIQRLEQFGATIEVIAVHAPVDGVITQLAVSEGAYVSPAAPVLTLAGPGRVWVELALSAEQLGDVQAGDPVTLRPAGAGPIEARIDYVNPMLDAGRGQARVELAQAFPELRLGTPVDATIHAARHEARTLPTAAVLRTGRGDYVMVAREGGAFLPVEVTPGVEEGDRIEIRGGVQEGIAVASNAQFLLDPAASLPDTLERARGTLQAMAMEPAATR